MCRSCQYCGTPNQEVGTQCQKCGGKVRVIYG